MPICGPLDLGSAINDAGFPTILFGMAKQKEPESKLN
jgi:hypothetical protein